MQRISHLNDELLAEYAVGRLYTTEVPAVFEHLLVCDECQERYEDELKFRVNLRTAMPCAMARQNQRGWLGAFAMPKCAWAAAAAVALTGFFAPPTPQRTQTALVELTANRGGHTNVVRAGDFVRLQVSRAGLNPPASVIVQIADETGREVWRSSPMTARQSWDVTPGTTFFAGRHWVRLLDPAGSDSLLREYAFDVR
jgi:hypothetical protein